MNMERISVGQLAKKAGVNVETVRYYERIGLMPRPQRLASGYRVYTSEDVTRLQFIKHAKKFGFTLNEIRELLSLKVDSKCNCEDIRLRAEEKIRDITEKIDHLQRIRNVLNQLVIACKLRQPTSECPILKAIDKEETSPPKT
jgi:MerR family mercuric resistance operon transcriptional regulator